MPPFSFKLQATLGKARAGQITTPHGVINTPIFMPVGTVASVKSLDSKDLIEAGADIILANTYHLGIREKTLKALQASEGIHNFMNWQRPVLTDSGGFQAFSLGSKFPHNSRSFLAGITEDGVSFRSHLDGSEHFFSPEYSMELQRIIGADIIMAFDDLMPDATNLTEGKTSLELTHAWAERCRIDWEKNKRQSLYGKHQAYFGIVQGALHPELRQQSAEFMGKLGVDGVAVGGETIGYNTEGTKDVMGWIEAILPREKPRYAMGMGRDLSDVAVAASLGFDMFDCVGPTRLARNGSLLVGSVVCEGESFRIESKHARGRLSIGRQEFSSDLRVLEENCDCTTCRAGYTRAYLHHLYKAKELSYFRLATIHNVRAMLRVSGEIRKHILENGVGE